MKNTTSAMKQGVVLQTTGSWYQVLDAEQKQYACRLKGQFRQKNLKLTNPIAVGDIVKFRVEDHGSSSIIDEILPRKNYIIRQSPRKKNHQHILASNIDLAIVIATINFPRTSQGFIDRFLLTCEMYKIPALILFNKIDLYRDKELDKLAIMLDIYESAGYPCKVLSALNEEHTTELMPLFQNKKTLVTGHSGVGKTSLLNSLVPEYEMKTQEISDYSGKGMHTTTFANMFQVGPDSFIIDTPGIKEWGLVDIEPEEISHYFPEMRELIHDCKFNNCVHYEEPKCRIKEGVAKGEISELRYISYLNILDNPM